MLAWILNKYVRLLRKKWREREPAGYMWLHPASLPEGKHGASATPSLAKQTPLHCWDLPTEVLPLSQKKMVTCAPFFPTKSFLLGAFLLSTTPPRPKGRETQQSNKVSLHLTWKCMWVCVLLSVGHNQKAKNLTQAGALSESLWPCLRCLLSSFLWLTSSSPWLLGLVCELCPGSQIGPKWTRAFPTAVKMPYARSRKHTF